MRNVVAITAAYTNKPIKYTSLRIIKINCISSVNN